MATVQNLAVLFDTPESWERIDLSKVEEREPLMPDLAPGVCSLLYAGKRTVFSGPPESVKSLVAYYQLLCAHRAGHKVLIIDLEMDEFDARDMLRYLGATADELAAIDYCTPDREPTDAVMNGLIAEGYELVVIDAAASAYSYSGLDDNARKDVERFQQMWIEPLRRYGIATLVIDHVTKSQAEAGGGSRDRYTIGSERKVGAVDAHIGFEVVQPLARGGRGIFTLWALKDRPAGLRVPDCGNYLGRLTIDSAPETFSLTLEFEPATPGGSAPATGGFEPTAIMGKIATYLEENPGASTRAIRQAVTSKAKWVDAGIKALVNGEYVEVKPEGTKKAHYLVKPYSGGGGEWPRPRQTFEEVVEDAFHKSV